MLSVNHYENDVLYYLLELFSICTLVMVSPMILLISYGTLHGNLNWTQTAVPVKHSFYIGSTDFLQLSLSVLIWKQMPVSIL
jgi:hypothetical protein